VTDDFQYLLVVGTLEPRKNHAMLLKAWERMKYGSLPDLKLVVVGGLGWDEKPLLRAMRPWIAKGDLYHLQDVPTSELRSLYRHALLTVCPSVAEGFDYSGVEAMRCGCPVASSDIPVHREIYAGASAYFDPYSPDEAAACMTRLAQSANERGELVRQGMLASGRYLPAGLLEQWRDYFERLHAAQRAKA
jgi:glycosyltransferase involved in cell wall biosynthesis